MALQIHSSLSPSETVCHLLEHSWPLRRYTVCENQRQSCARQLESPYLHQTGVVIYSLVWVHRAWGRCEQVPGSANASGRYASDVPDTVGIHMGMRPLATPARQASLVSG